MENSQTLGIVLAAGNSKRMNSKKSKLLFDLAGNPAIKHVVQKLFDFCCDHVVVVTSPDLQDDIKNFGFETIIQNEAKGTGNAVLATLSYLQQNRQFDNIVIMCGDAPLFKPETLTHLSQSRSLFSMLISKLDKEDIELPYGRVEVVEPAQDSMYREAKSIIEYKDATDLQRQIIWMNSGVYKIKSDLLIDLVQKIEPSAQTGEYYLTDIVSMANSQDIRPIVIECPFNETIGFNTRIEFERVSQLYQKDLQDSLRQLGVTFLQPDTTRLSFDTKIGQDTVIEGNVVIGPGVIIEDDVHIKSFSYVEHSTIQHGASIGPFAHIRGHTTIGANAVIGNFVELKNSIISEKTKIKHLSYLGDCTVGAQSNIGAGVITANYDGFAKYKTHIGERVSVGANTVLVAPINIGCDAMTGAGSTITKDVAAGDLGISRTKQENKTQWAVKFKSSKFKNN